VTSSPALLHNMSSRPRTAVEIRVPPIDINLAAFALDNMAPALSRVTRRRTRAVQRHTLAAFVCGGDVARLGEQLDRAWTPLALRGAVLLHPGPARPRSADVTWCRDPLLVLNVLARARANVLIPDAPLVLQPQALDRLVVTDDPRLTSLVCSEPRRYG